MFYVYVILSVLSVFVTNLFCSVFKQSYSWWLVPLLLIGYFLVFFIFHLAVFFISFQIVDINKPIKHSGYYRKLVKLSLPLIIKLSRVKVEAEGTQKVPTDRKMLFVCNHQHDFDPIIIINQFPDNDLGFIGKKEIYTEMPFVGKAMHAIHSLPIDRENNRAAVKTILAAADYIKEGTVSVGLFPEGYTSRTCELLPFRNGAFKIAFKANAPIVVCVINNTRSIPRRMFRLKTKVSLKVLDVIYPEQYKDMNTVELGDKIHSQMEKALKELRG